ncbi:hypothetical protein EH220_05255 [bacterium]|nr:MAG: hypothetical protein EH220_05255 [bacterium]
MKRDGRLEQSAIRIRHSAIVWGDFQIQLYCWYIEQTFGWRISGIVYNILAKAKLRQKQGETEDEYQARCAELIAKSKSGKTTAKRKMPETDEEFQARLAEWYAQPDAFHREMLFVSRDQFDTLRAEPADCGFRIGDCGLFAGAGGFDGSNDHRENFVGLVAQVGNTVFGHQSGIND